MGLSTYIIWDSSKEELPLLSEGEIFKAQNTLLLLQDNELVMRTSYRHCGQCWEYLNISLVSKNIQSCHRQKKKKKSKQRVMVQSESCSKWCRLKVSRSCDGPSEKGLFSGRKKVRKCLRKEMLYEVNLSG